MFDDFEDFQENTEENWVGQVFYLGGLICDPSLSNEDRERMISTYMDMVNKIATAMTLAIRYSAIMHEMESGFSEEATPADILRGSADAFDRAIGGDAFDVLATKFDASINEVVRRSEKAALIQEKLGIRFSDLSKEEVEDMIRNIDDYELPDFTVEDILNAKENNPKEENND